MGNPGLLIWLDTKLDTPSSDSSFFAILIDFYNVKSLVYADSPQTFKSSNALIIPMYHGLQVVVVLEERRGYTRNRPPPHRTYSYSLTSEGWHHVYPTLWRPSSSSVGVCSIADNVRGMRAIGYTSSRWCNQVHARQDNRQGCQRTVVGCSISWAIVRWQSGFFRVHRSRRDWIQWYWRDRQRGRLASVCVPRRCNQKHEYPQCWRLEKRGYHTSVTAGPMPEEALMKLSRLLAKRRITRRPWKALSSATSFLTLSESLKT